ncbi:O-antigen ligase family protein [Micromonospora sp. WMMD980]|uniref:O-antigen ligase family protein n=1 Tax=Micromonospora sp. WMMD980 TaxID=3016088 RepID=UPI0024174149|nr:O-antigen ligase family protein [Micromonospora sp. WMMD980]MDG4802580.1 O-antigen ligase family protein [Micromonospora sp. WMMD980]
MTRSSWSIWPPAALALSVGLLAGWRPLLAGVAALVALAGWALWDPARLNHALFAVLFLVPVTVRLGGWDKPVWMVLLTATAIALYGRLQRLRPDEPLGSAGAAAFALPVAGVLAAPAHWSGPKDLVFALAPFGCYAVVTWHVVAEARRDPAAFVRLARFFAWLGVPLALLAVHQRVTGTWPVLDELATSNAFTSSAGAGRSVATTGHPIVYGAYCLMSMGVALALRGRAWPVPFAAGVVGLLLSGSRSAWIGVGCAGVVWYLTRRPRLTRQGVAAIAATAAGAVALALAGPAPVRGAVDMVRARMSDVGGSSSATARYRRYEVAWDALTDGVDRVLFGLGPEAHVRFFQEVGIDDHLAQTFDNSFLTLWYDLGLVTLLPFLALLVILVVRTRSLAARLLVVGMTAQIFFFDFYLWPCAAAVLILAAGLAAADRDVDAGHRPATPLAVGAGSPAEAGKDHT